MNRLTSFLVAILVMALTVTPRAQTTTPAGLLSNTTLSGAINSTQTTLVLASASASSGSSFGAPAAGQCLYVDYELMRIVSMSSTTATVTRGTTGRSSHANAAIVLTGPCGSSTIGGFMQAPPNGIGGNQTCSAFILPWVNTTNGDSWWCDQVTNVWSVTNTVTRNGTTGSRRVAQ